jgi:hypothetical protein
LNFINNLTVFLKFNLFLFKDIRKEIRKIGQFLNKKLTDEQIEKLVEHVKVDNFSKNKSVNLTMEIESGLINEGHSFVRKGKNLKFKIKCQSVYNL